MLLTFEKMYSTINGVWNLSSDQVVITVKKERKKTDDIHSQKYLKHI